MNFTVPLEWEHVFTNSFFAKKLSRKTKGKRTGSHYQSHWLKIEPTRAVEICSRSCTLYPAEQYYPEDKTAWNSVNVEKQNTTAYTEGIYG